MFGTMRGTFSSRQLVERDIAPITATWPQNNVMAAVAVGDADIILTAAQITNSAIVIHTTGLGAHTVTTPTAALTVAALTDPQIGTNWPFVLIELSGNNSTLTAGANYTLVGNADVNNENSLWWALVTAVAVPAITMYRCTSG